MRLSGDRSAHRGRGSLAGQRIVVVGINYRPETTGIAPYTTAFCEMLAAAGATVTAVVGLPHYPAWSVPEDYQQGMRDRETINGVQVLRSSHHVPSRQTILRRGAYEASFLVNSRRVSRRLDADAIIAVTPALASLSVAHDLARRNDAAFGVIVQDLVGNAAEQSGIRRGGTVSGAIAAAERRGILRADLVAVISQGFAETLVGTGIDPARISLLPNHSHIGSTTATRNDARIQLGWAHQEFVVLHTGNMGLKQDLGNVVEAARLASQTDSPIRFILMGDGSQRGPIARQAASLSNLTMLPPIDARLYPVALAAADVLLINERASVVNMSLPSKLTSYFTAGRPVLAAVPADGSTHCELRASAAGLQVSPSDPRALLDAVVRLIDDSETRGRLGSAGRAYAQSKLGRADAAERSLSWVHELLGLEPETAVPAPTYAVSQLRAPVLRS
jgi:glycosyltransferase involved in cell wall biosynthesis